MAELPNTDNARIIREIGLYDTNVSYMLHNLPNMDSWTEWLEELVKVVTQENRLLKERELKCVHRNGYDHHMQS